MEEERVNTLKKRKRGERLGKKQRERQGGVREIREEGKGDKEV